MINDENLKFRCIFLFLTDILVSAIFASHTAHFFQIKSLLDRDVAQILYQFVFKIQDFQKIKKEKKEKKKEKRKKKKEKRKKKEIKK